MAEKVLEVMMLRKSHLAQNDNTCRCLAAVSRQLPRVPHLMRPELRQRRGSFSLRLHGMKRDGWEPEAVQGLGEKLACVASLHEDDRLKRG